MFSKLLEAFGYVKKKDIINKLNYARCVDKRLDEHRELVINLERIGFLNDDEPWHINHLATQDDYLMRLYFMVYGCYPENNLIKNRVRCRPEILGICDLPEYNENKNIIKKEDL